MAKADSSEMEILPMAMTSAVTRLTAIMRPTGAVEAALPLVPGAVLEALEHDPRVAWAAPVGFGDFYRGHPLIGDKLYAADDASAEFPRHDR